MTTVLAVHRAWRNLETASDNFKYYKLYRAKNKPSEPRALKPPKRKSPLLLVPREVARSKLYSKK